MHERERTPSDGATRTAGVEYDAGMKKLIVVIAMVGAVVGGWRWMRSEPAHEAAADIVRNRIWIDHMPVGEKDTHAVFALWQPEAFGVFANRNRWRVELERFRYEMTGGEVQAVWPLSGVRRTLTIKAEKCRVDDWDFCLEIEGAPSGVRRYYSRVGWERKDRRSVDEAIADVLGEE